MVTVCLVITVDSGNYRKYSLPVPNLKYQYLKLSVHSIVAYIATRSYEQHKENEYEVYRIRMLYELIESKKFSPE